GTKVVSDFPLFISSAAATSGTAYTLSAGAYTASETSQAGYAASAWGGDCAANGSITLALADNKTCTITNDDIAPTLKLVKNVINDNGGTKTAADWTLTATGSAGFADAGNSTTFHPVSAGVQYALSESTVSGYAFEGWSCSGGGTFVSPDKITLGLAENVTCTATNNDIPMYGGSYPTNTTCQMFLAGTPEENVGQFSLRGNKISQVNPGVIFYYTKFTVPGGGATINITQGAIPPSLWMAVQQVSVYTGSCETYKDAVVGGTDGSVSVNFPAGGTYIVGVKYSPNSIVGNVWNTADILYGFKTYIGSILVDQDISGFSLTWKKAL
ncbi:MAG: hypothetical protein ACYC7H_05375, partial [Chloroflexota bacterium]